MVGTKITCKVDGYLSNRRPTLSSRLRNLLMRTHLSLVNQKLGFASTLLLLAADSELISVGSLRCRAIQESILLHLYTAFHFYQRELAELNGIKMPELIDSMDSLVNGLNQLGKQPSEVLELQSICAEKGSWLNQLLNHYKLIFISPPKAVEKKAFVQEGMIELVDVSQDAIEVNAELDLKILAEWLNEFKALILRHRETGAEY